MAIRRGCELPGTRLMAEPDGNGKSRGIAPHFPESKAMKRIAPRKSCLQHDLEKFSGKFMLKQRDLAVHSSEAALRWPRLPRKFHRLNACRIADFAVRPAYGRCAL
ncbi:MAG: hypothetical protein ACLQDM_03215 [Bradyrhizobium sp.]